MSDFSPLPTPALTLSLAFSTDASRQEPVSQFDKTVIPGEQNDVERDPWFDRPFDKLTVLSKVEGLTTLSEVEGESRKRVGSQVTLDPGSHPAPRDLAGMTNCGTASKLKVSQSRGEENARRGRQL